MRNKVGLIHYTEIIVFFVFVISQLVISYYHEPWFDEAQAWQIARCASLKEIIFEIPHFEGHPPLWHLLLCLVAKIGIPFEIGLKIIGIVISVSSASLFFFKSRLPTILRFTIPFTYFFFYQYGVIVRPYSLMLLLMILIGMCLGKKKEKPWLISTLLCLLCLTSAYGILFAGGIALCIVWEIIEEKGLLKTISELFNDHRSLSLLSLLFVAMLLIIEILPSPEAYAFTYQGDTPLYLRIICALFTFPVECFLSTSSWFGIEQVSMQTIQLPKIEFSIFVILGFFLLCFLLVASPRHGARYLLIPYTLFCLFSAVVYFSTHHLGLVFVLVLFWIEYVSREESAFYLGRVFLDCHLFSDSDRILFKKTYKYMTTICVIIPLFWSLSSSILDIQNYYCFARSMAHFIKNNSLDNYVIIGRWTETGSTHSNSEGNKDYINTYIVGDGVLLDSYFGRNIIANFNEGEDKDTYVHHKMMSYEDSRKKVNVWTSRGIPDVIIGIPDLRIVYGDSFTYDDYKCIYREKSGFIWKGRTNQGFDLLYLKNDIFDQMNLDNVYDADLRMRYEGLHITEEMKNKYNNGVPVDEILEPYLDEMFGKNDFK